MHTGDTWGIYQAGTEWLKHALLCLLPHAYNPNPRHPIPCLLFFPPLSFSPATRQPNSSCAFQDSQLLPFTYFAIGAALLCRRGFSPSVRPSVLWLVVRLHTPRFVCFQNFRCHEILTLSMSFRLSSSMAPWAIGDALRYGAVRKFVATIGSCCEQVASTWR